MWRAACGRPAFFACLVTALVSVAVAVPACDYTLSPTDGLVGIKEILDTAAYGSNVVICLTSGVFTATNATELPLDPARLASVTIIGEGGGNTVIDGANLGSCIESSASGDAVTIIDLDIVNCVGHAVSLSSSFLNMTSVTVADCTSTGSGAGVKCVQCDFVIDTCEFRDNSALFGGGMFVHYGAGVVTRTLFYGNSGGERGGGFTSYRAFVNVSNSVFESNSALSGGGVYVSQSGRCRVENTIFVGSSGAAVFVELAAADLDGVLCQANGDVGVYVHTGNVSVRNTAVCGHAETDVLCNAAATVDPESFCGYTCKTSLASTGWTTDHLPSLPYSYDYVSCDDVDCPEKSNSVIKKPEPEHEDNTVDGWSTTLIVLVVCGGVGGLAVVTAVILGVLAMYNVRYRGSGGELAELETGDGGGGGGGGKGVARGGPRNNYDEYSLEQASSSGNGDDGHIQPGTAGSRGTRRAVARGSGRDDSLRAEMDRQSQRSRRSSGRSRKGQRRSDKSTTKTRGENKDVVESGKRLSTRDPARVVGSDESGSSGSRVNELGTAPTSNASDRGNANSADINNGDKNNNKNKSDEADGSKITSPSSTTTATASRVHKRHGSSSSSSSFSSSSSSHGQRRHRHSSSSSSSQSDAQRRLARA